MRFLFKALDGLAGAPVLLVSLLELGPLQDASSGFQGASERLMPCKEECYSLVILWRGSSS